MIVSIFQRHGPQRDPKIKQEIETRKKKKQKYDNSFNLIIGVCNKTWQKANTVVVTDFISQKVNTVVMTDFIIVVCSFGEIVLKFCGT